MLTPLYHSLEDANDSDYRKKACKCLSISYLVVTLVAIGTITVYACLGKFPIGNAITAGALLAISTGLLSIAILHCMRNMAGCID